MAELQALVDSWENKTFSGDFNEFIKQLAAFFGKTVEQILAPGGEFDSLVQNGDIQRLQDTLEPIAQSESLRNTRPPTQATNVVERLDPTGGDLNQQFFAEGGTVPGGRPGVFSAFTARNFADFTPASRDIIRDKFNPLNATFALGRTGAEGENFRDFLASRPQSFNAEQFGAAISRLSPLFSGPADQLTRDQQTRLNLLLENDPQQLITAVEQSRFAPSARNAVARVVSDRFDRRRDTDPQRPRREILADFFSSGSFN